MTPLTAAVALVLAAGVARGLSAQDAAPSVTVAAVDGSGTLVPIARFADERWHATWPLVDEERIPQTLDAVPTAWLGIPLPRGWTLWPAGGGAPAPLRLVAPIYAGACVGPLGFTTELTHVPGSGGIAVDGLNDVQQPVALDETDASTDAVLRVLKNALRGGLQREKTAWPTTFALRQVPSGPVTEAVELLLSHRTGSRDVVFATLTAVYAGVRAGDWVFALGVRLTAWIEDTGSGPRLIRTHVESFSPDEDKARRQRPLGIVSIGGREFWVLEQLYYESRDFGIVEISPGRVSDVVDAASESGC